MFVIRHYYFDIAASSANRHPSLAVLSLDMPKPAQPQPSKDHLSDEFLRYLAVERNASSKTLKAYGGALAKIRVHLNGKPWLKCQADDFRDYLFHLSKEKAARS